MLKVTLMLRTTVNGKRKWQGLNSKGTLSADVVASGTWYIKWMEGGKPVRIAIGAMSVDEAKHRQAEKALELGARALQAKRQVARGSNDPVPAGWVDPQIAQAEYEAAEKAEKDRAQIADYIARYNRENGGYTNSKGKQIAGKKKASTALTYKRSLEHFVTSCKRTYIDELKRRDILSFIEYLKAEGHGERSIHNVVKAVFVFLKWAAIIATEHGGNEALRPMAADAAASLSIRRADRPQPEDDEVSVYRTDELKKLYAVATEDELVWLKFFEFTGMRDSEVRHAEWSWVDWPKGTITVQANKAHNWTPKSRSSKREIPMPPVLLKMLLKTYEARPAKCGLIFPTANCEPNQYFLEQLARVAKRAGLDAESFWLHKFRATYATQCLRSGVDVFTVKSWLGHSPKDMTTIGRYVAYLQGEKANTQMAKVQFASA